MIASINAFLLSIPQLTGQEAFVAAVLTFAVLLLFHTFCSAVETSLYCIRIHRYEKAILAAKDCDKLCVRPPFCLWSKFKLSQFRGDKVET